MILFDVGANKGDAVLAGLKLGYKVIALEPAPRVFKDLVSNFIYNPNVIPLKLAVSSTDNDQIEFYEAEEDGLSSINKDWLTSDQMPYNGKPFRSIYATTITIDKLSEIYGVPDLIKIDVEGAEWHVFKGINKKYGRIVFEWTRETINEHVEQLKYLKSLGYTEYGPQFIEHHLQEPTTWLSLENPSLDKWILDNAKDWEDGLWKGSNLRPTSDVGMCWVR